MVDTYNQHRQEEETPQKICSPENIWKHLDAFSEELQTNNICANDKIMEIRMKYTFKGHQKLLAELLTEVKKTFT